MLAIEVLCAIGVGIFLLGATVGGYGVVSYWRASDAGEPWLTVGCYLTGCGLALAAVMFTLVGLLT